MAYLFDKRPVSGLTGSCHDGGEGRNAQLDLLLPHQAEHLKQGLEYHFNRRVTKQAMHDKEDREPCTAVVKSSSTSHIVCSSSSAGLQAEQSARRCALLHAKAQCSPKPGASLHAICDRRSHLQGFENLPCTHARFDNGVVRHDIRQNLLASPHHALQQNNGLHHNKCSDLSFADAIDSIRTDSLWS